MTFSPTGAWPYLYQGSGSKPYEINPHDPTKDDGVEQSYWCTCPAWKNSKAPKGCKHIKMMLATSSPTTQLPASLTPATASPKKPKRRGPKLPAPMKLETLADGDAGSVISSEEWVMEQKVDGTRCTATVRADGSCWFGNGSGETLSHAASAIHFNAIEQALPHLDEDYTLDGELLWTGHYWVFDLIQFGDEKMESRWSIRAAALARLFEDLEIKEPVHLLPTAYSLEEKRDLLRRVEAQGGEGVVLKHVDAPYVQGTRSLKQLKVKFTKTVDCIVTERDSDGKCNAHLSLYSNDRVGLVGIGKCSMIGKPDAQVGDVVEVRYLYATDDLTLFQPTLLKPRFDKKPEDCLMSQLSPVNKEIVLL